MVRITAILSSLSILLIALNATATMPSERQKNGRAVYEQSCSACHGVNALGNTAFNAPRLAGQLESYLEAQLHNFSNGARGGDSSDIQGQQMAVIARSLIAAESGTLENSKQTVFTEISSYLASLDRAKSMVTDAKTASGNNAGYKIYQASCGACHANDASGNNTFKAPSLAGLGKSYLKRQYALFLSGKRGQGAGDKYGRQMSMIANTLTEQSKVDAAIDYIVSLSVASPNESGIEE